MKLGGGFCRRGPVSKHIWSHWNSFSLSIFRLGDYSDVLTFNERLEYLSGDMRQVLPTTPSHWPLIIHHKNVSPNVPLIGQCLAVVRVKWLG